MLLFASADVCKTPEPLSRVLTDSPPPQIVQTAVSEVREAEEQKRAAGAESAQAESDSDSPLMTHRHAVPGTHRVTLAGLELDGHVLRQHRVQPVVALDVVLRCDLPGNVRRSVRGTHDAPGRHTLSLSGCWSDVGGRQRQRLFCR